MRPDPLTASPSRLAVQPAISMFALFLLTQLTLASVLQIADVGFGLLFSEIFFLAAPVVLWTLGAGLAPAPVLKLRRVPAELVALGAAAGLANFFASGTLQVLTRKVLPQDLAQQFDVAHIFRDASGFELGLVLVAVGAAAPVCEELAFRGYLQSVLGARLRSSASIAVVAALFAALHLDPVGFLARFELGLLFGALVLWSGSLWPAIAAHAANNLLAASLFLATLGEAPSEQSTTPVTAALLYGSASALVTASLLAVFRRRAQRQLPPIAEPVEDDEAPAVAFSLARTRRVLVPLLAGGLAALALFAALGWRGAAVNYVDLTTAVRRLEQRVPDAGRRERLQARLREARRLAKRGEVDLEAYRSMRLALAGGSDNDAPLSPEQVESAFARLGLAGAPPEPDTGPDGSVEGGPQ